MELIFMPFFIVFLFWKEKEADEILVSIFYTLYAIGLYFFSELPTNSKIGSLFIGIPSISYLLYIFPSLIQHDENAVKTTAFIMLVIISFILVYFQVVEY